MALGHGPRVVTDGLVLALDAGDTNSYPGSGTTWYDLSGNGYNGTMSDVTITSDGHMSFNGQNPGSAVAFPESNISKDPSLYLGDSSGRFTYECWVNKQGEHHNPASTARIMSTDVSDYNGILWYGSSNENHPNKLIFYYDGNVQTGTDLRSSSTLSTNTWYHIVCICDASLTTGNIKIYINGEEDASKNFTNDSDFGKGTSRAFAIGSNTENAVQYNQGLNGYIDICRIYGKPLSVDEVKQNFNALRGRFGI